MTEKELRSGNTRRALTQVGGEVDIWCDELGLGSILTSALHVEPEAPSATRHVHGFHSYPARMHPDTAHALVAGLTGAGQTILDPFCGSGTVLVEARLLERVAYGVDANPLAVALAGLKLSGLSQEAGQELVAVAEAVTEYADERRLRKAGPTRPYGNDLRALFAPHVLLELDGLNQGIEQCASEQQRRALRLVLSSMLNKVSLRQSDTNGRLVEKRLASGFVLRFFKKKTTELVARLAQYSAQVGQPRVAMGVKLGDARELPMDDGRAHAIVTSPPYPGVYDYVEHHRVRLSFLGLDSGHLQNHEILAHRDYAYADSAQAMARWAEQFGPCLAEMRRVLAPGGKIALLMADSVVAREAFYVDRALAELVPRHGLRIVGGVSQRRRHYHAPTQRAFSRAPRREHLIVLAAAPGRPQPRQGYTPVQIQVKPSTRHGNGKQRRVP